MKNNAATKGELIWFGNLIKVAFDLSILGWVGTKGTAYKSGMRMHMSICKNRETKKT